MAPPRQVLVVDDEPIVRAAASRVLGSAGFAVETASDVATGLAHPALATCALLLCDLMLPDGSGIDVVRRARRTRPDLPVVAMTGYATNENEIAAVDAGAAAFLPKPFTAAELLDVVHRALAEDGANEETLR